MTTKPVTGITIKVPVHGDDARDAQHEGELKL